MENTSDSFMPRPLLFCLKSGRSVCYSVPDNSLSMDKIAAGLERDGILTGAGGKKWHTSTINKILRNEKYIGDALLQKTYTTDFLNKTRVKNNGLVPQYYVEGDHEAIIPKDIYLQVQEELVRRRVVKTSANGKKLSYSCNPVSYTHLTLPTTPYV